MCSALIIVHVFSAWSSLSGVSCRPSPAWRRTSSPTSAWTPTWTAKTPGSGRRSGTYLPDSVSDPVQHFIRLITNRDPVQDPDPGFWWPSIEKSTAGKNWKIRYARQCFGYGSSILDWIPIRIRFRFRIQGFDDTKMKKIYTWKICFIIFLNKNYNLLILLGLHKGRPSYRRSLNRFPARQNIKFLKFSYFCGSFLPSWTRIYSGCLVAWNTISYLETFTSSLFCVSSER